MSKAQEAPEPEEKITKKVDIILYLNCEDGETRRQFADRVDGERDYFEKEEDVRENTKYYLRYRGTDVSLGEDQFDALRDADLGDAIVTEEITKEVNKDWKWSPSKVIDEEIDSIIDRVYEEDFEFPEGWEEYWFGKKLKDNEGYCKVNYYRSFERIPMLKHPSEISPEDMYMDEDEDYLAYKLKVRIKEVNEETLEHVNDNLVGSLMNRLGRHKWVDKVRVYECEQETKQEGVCFNL